jgi:hypothetical protein
MAPEGMRVLSFSGWQAGLLHGTAVGIDQRATCIQTGLGHPGRKVPQPPHSWRSGVDSYLEMLPTQGHINANDVDWPEFDGT